LNQFLLSVHLSKPRRGGLFIESRQIIPPFFLFFSGAARRGLDAPEPDRAGVWGGASAQSRAAEKQKG